MIQDRDFNTGSFPRRIVDGTHFSTAHVSCQFAVSALIVIWSTFILVSCSGVGSTVRTAPVSSSASTPIIGAVRSGPDTAPPICGLKNDITNHIPDAAGWADFAPPPAGGTYADVAYGCPVTRLTNASTDAGSAGEVHYYSLTSPMSAADTKVMIFDQNGDWHIIDTSGKVVVSISKFPSNNQGIPVWDVADDNVFWIAVGNTLRKCTVNGARHSAACSVNHTFSEYRGYVVNIPDKGDMSPGGWIAMTGQSVQGGPFDIFMFNPATEAKSPAYTQRYCNGDVASKQPGCLHSTTVFVGQYMTADFEAGSPTGSVWWALPFVAPPIAIDAGDHSDLGLDINGKIVGAFEDYQPFPGPWGNCQHAFRPTIVPYSSSGVPGAPECLFDNRSDNPGWHVSFRDSLQRAWVALSTQASSSAEYFNNNSSYQVPSNSNWNVYTNEIVLARVDADNDPTKIYRLALTHSRMQESGKYWTSPRVALSRDGNYVIFDSNAAWGKSGCGKISTCVDVYLIKIH